MTWLPRLRSLQSRLLALLLCLLTGVWLGAAALTWRDASHELDELLDGHLAQAAALLVVQQARTDDNDADDVADALSLHKYAPKVAFQVFHEGRLIMRSANAGLLPMSADSRGFSTVELADGHTWRVFVTQGGESDVQVFVGEETSTRDDILWAVLQGVLLPMLLALPLLGLLLWWAVRHGLAPLRHLSQVLAARQPQALEPVVLQDVPSEIQPVVQSLNALFERIDNMVASERRFTADAAHELRTPIAAIRTQAQVALGAGNDATQRDHALHITLAGCDRATRLVEQLLTLSRLEASTSPGSAMPLTTSLDMSALTRRTLADLVPAALRLQQEVTLDATSPCLVTGDETLLGVLVRNLIDNASRYSPPGASVQVSVSAQSGQTELQVHDSGPGMTEPEMARLGERFYRVLGNEQPGSGLGWSIVRRISEVCGAQIRVQRSELLGGLSVIVRWPAIVLPTNTG